MKNRLAIGACLAALASLSAHAEDRPPGNARGRAELAKRIYRERVTYGFERRSDPPAVLNPPDGLEDPLLNERTAEDLHNWSVRWMDAECDAASDRAGRLAAAQEHLRRMKSLETGTMVREQLADVPWVKEKIEKDPDSVDTPPDKMLLIDGLSISGRRYPDVARFFRLEAEARLATEQARP